MPEVIFSAFGFVVVPVPVCVLIICTQFQMRAGGKIAVDFIYSLNCMFTAGKVLENQRLLKASQEQG